MRTSPFSLIGLYHKIENSNVFNCIHDQRQDCNDNQLKNCSLPLESKLDLVWNVSIRSQALRAGQGAMQGPGLVMQHHQHSKLRQRSIARVLSKGKHSKLLSVFREWCPQKEATIRAMFGPILQSKNVFIVNNNAIQRLATSEEQAGAERGRARRA